MPVPRPGPAAVELRRVDVDLDRETRPRLLVRQEVAALSQEHVVEQRLDLRDAHGLPPLHVRELPARRCLRHQGARLRIDERGADVAEVEGFANAGAHPAQDLGVRRLPRDARRHLEQRLERPLVSRRLRRLACRLDGERRVVGE